MLLRPFCVALVIRNYGLSRRASRCRLWRTLPGASAIRCQIAVVRKMPLEAIFIFVLLCVLTTTGITSACCCFNICACCADPSPSFCVAVTVCGATCGCAPSSVTIGLSEVIIEPPGISNCLYFWKTWYGTGAMTGCVIHDGVMHVRLQCLPFSDGCLGYKLSVIITNDSTVPVIWGTYDSEAPDSPCECGPDPAFTLIFPCGGVTQNDQCYPCIGIGCDIPAAFSFVVTKCP